MMALHRAELLRDSRGAITFFLIVVFFCVRRSLRLKHETLRQTSNQAGFIKYKKAGSQN
jgi:hypothetical protein